MIAGIYLLLLVLLSNLLITGSFWPILGILSAIAHELGHLVAMKVLKVRHGNIRFKGFGISIRSDEVVSYRQGIWIWLAGPLMSALLGTLSLILFLLIGSKSCLLMLWINYLYTIFNLLPVPPLDGYHLLRQFLLLKLEYHSAIRCLRFVLITAVFLLLTVIVCFWIGGFNNLYLYFILFSMIPGIFATLYGQKS